MFDKRLFDNDIFEDFNEKVTTLSEEELFLMSAIFVSYFCKLFKNDWKGEKIDQYVVNYMLHVIFVEIKKILKGQTYSDWFSVWDKVF